MSASATQGGHKKVTAA